MRSSPAATITRTREAASEKTMCWFPPFFQRSPANQLSSYATYQTNLNHPRHSNFAWLRLTLRMLWILRAPFIVRTSFLVFLLALLVSTSAGAARINAVRKPAHASVGKATVHRANPSLHPASHSSRIVPRKSAKVSATNRSHTTARRGTRYASSSSHRVTSTRHSATLRRTRYNNYSSRGHFVPLATVPVPPSRIQSDQLSAAPAVGPASEPDSSRPHADVSSAAGGSDTPGETDTLPSPRTDRAAMAAGSNPLSAPREGTQPLTVASGQVAELTRPPMFTGRVSSYTLRGTHDSLVRQNERSEDEALERIEDDADLDDRISRGLLVRVPESSALSVNAGSA